MLRLLGFPDPRRHPAMVTGIGIDALGSGLFLPVSVLYFLSTTPVSMADVGLALSISGLAAIPLVLLSGALVDRFGPKRLMLAANLVQALGYAAYVAADSMAAIVVVSALTTVGMSAFWSSYSPMVAAATEPGEREVWFGFLGALRNIGFAIGGLAAGVAVQIGTPAAFRALVLINAASFLLAYAVLLRVPTGGPVPVDSRTPRERGGWARLLADRPYLLLVSANASYALCVLTLNVAIPVYALRTLGVSGWVTGALFTFNTVLVGLGQGLVVRAMDGHRRHRIVGLGQGMYAASFVALAAAAALPAEVTAGAVFLAVAIYTLGELLGGPVLTAAAVEAAPANLRGRYLAAYQLSWSLATILAPAAYLWLLERGRFPLWAALIAVATAGAVLASAAARRLPAASARVTSTTSA